MKSSHRLLILGLLTLAFAACNSGGKGTTGENTVPLCEPGEFRPAVPAGIGLAGLMQGTWEIDSFELMPDPRNVNAGASPPFVRIGFNDGVVSWPDGAYPVNEPGAPRSDDVTLDTDFYCNEVSNSVTFYAFGTTWSNSRTGLNGATRLGAVIGTTNTTSAEAIVIEQQVVRGAYEVDRFAVWHVELRQ
ncbi:MAG: hypothetical protein KDC98_04410 [Planctomycetes bacterium]|nr:hypothetical protein [Planctomycetota bacterium]